MKKQTKTNKLLALFAASIALVFLQAPPVYADRGLTITPSYIKVQFASNETQQDIAISVTNNFLQDIDIEVKPIDVDTASNTLAPLGTNTSIATKTVSVAKPLLHIGASKSVNIIAHINGLELPPGGQYTALLIHPLDATNKQIPLQQAVSVGIFIAKQEGTVKKLVPTISLPKGLLVHKPKTIEVKLKNSGNTELVPYASFLIKKGDEVVAKAIINEDSIPLFAGQASNYIRN